VKLRPSEELTEDEAAIVAEVSDTKAKRFDKLKALELLGRHLGMFIDRQEVTAKVSAADPYEELTTEELRRLARLADEQ
jgi:phage terminase small subunit